MSTSLRNFSALAPGRARELAVAVNSWGLNEAGFTLDIGFADNTQAVALKELR